MYVLKVHQYDEDYNGNIVSCGIWDEEYKSLEEARNAFIDKAPYWGYDLRLLNCGHVIGTWGDQWPFESKTKKNKK